MGSKKFEAFWKKFSLGRYSSDKANCKVAYEAGYSEAQEEIRGQVRQIAKILSQEKVTTPW